MTIRTQDERIILPHSTCEIIREEAKLDNEPKYYLWLMSLDNPNNKIKLHETDNEENHWNVFCQMVGLMRSRNTQMLDFEAMERNPNKKDYINDSIEFKEKKAPKKNNLKSRYGN